MNMKEHFQASKEHITIYVKPGTVFFYFFWKYKTENVVYFAWKTSDSSVVKYCIDKLIWIVYDRKAVKQVNSEKKLKRLFCF